MWRRTHAFDSLHARYRVKEIVHDNEKVEDLAVARREFGRNDRAIDHC